MSPETRLAIQKFGAAIKAEARLYRINQELTEAVQSIPAEDMDEYIRVTDEMMQPENRSRDRITGEEVPA